MKLAKLETLRLAEFPNLVWLRLHTDEGVFGLGETSFAAESVETYLHEFVAPRVLGRNPLEVERLARELTGYLGFRGSASRRVRCLPSTSRCGTSTAGCPTSRSTRC
jgi:galactonate dehydratase